MNTAMVLLVLSYEFCYASFIGFHLKVLFFTQLHNEERDFIPLKEEVLFNISSKCPFWRVALFFFLFFFLILFFFIAVPHIMSGVITREHATPYTKIMGTVS